MSARAAVRAEGRVEDDRRILRLPCPAAAAAAPHPASDLHRVAAAMWAGWGSLEHWEDEIADEFGVLLGEIVVLLWIVHRFGGAECLALVDAALDDGGDPLLLDVASTAFALGAAWRDSRGR